MQTRKLGPEGGRRCGLSPIACPCPGAKPPHSIQAGGLLIKPDRRHPESFNSRKNPLALWDRVRVRVFRPRATVAGARGVRPHPRPLSHGERGELKDPGRQPDGQEGRGAFPGKYDKRRHFATFERGTPGVFAAFCPVDVRFCRVNVTLCPGFVAFCRRWCGPCLRRGDALTPGPSPTGIGESFDRALQLVRQQAPP